MDSRTQKLNKQINDLILTFHHYDIITLPNRAFHTSIDLKKITTSAHLSPKTTKQTFVRA